MFDDEKKLYGIIHGGLENDIKVYKPKEFAKLINVTVGTLQRWDRTGILKAKRTPTDRRYYTNDDLVNYLTASKKNNIERDEMTC